MKLIITGSRDEKDPTKVYEFLFRALAKAKSRNERLKVAHGHCPTGVDFFADQWCIIMKMAGEPVDVKRYPANWEVEGNGAGPNRNRKMVNENMDAEAVLGFPKGRSKGTRGCMKYADQMGLKVYNLEDK